VRHDAVDTIPNEFLKEHRKVEDQQTTIAQLKAQLSRGKKTNAQQTKAIKNLTAALKEQANAIQKVSARLELMKPAGNRSEQPLELFSRQPRSCSRGAPTPAAQMRLL
jgi:septal ring factor EnvC (AmiA/AmiB activator)